MKNFGQIKNHIINDLTKSYVNKTLSENKKLEKFLNVIKESDVLRAEFSIYRNIENFTSISEIAGSQYLKNNIALMDCFSDNEIISEHAKLLKTFNITKLDEVSDEKLKSIYESITNLIFLNNSINTVNIISESTETIIGHFKTNIVESKDIKVVDANLLKSVSKDKIKEHYSDKLSESELAIVDTIVKGDSKQQKSLLNDMVSECMKHVNDNLVDADLNTKEKLLNVKASLLDVNYVSETFKDDAKKLLSLLNGFKKI